jgi:hypothetical protein
MPHSGSAVPVRRQLASAQAAAEPSIAESRRRSDGKTVLKGDNHVKLIRVEGGRMRLDPAFDIDLNSSKAYAATSMVPLGPMRPHGLVIR